MRVRARRLEEDNIIAHISSIIEKGIDNFTEEDQLKLTESQNKLMTFTEGKLRVHSFALGRSGLRRESKIPLISSD